MDGSALPPAALLPEDPIVYWCGKDGGSLHKTWVMQELEEAGCERARDPR